MINPSFASIRPIRLQIMNSGRESAIPGTVRASMRPRNRRFLCLNLNRANAYPPDMPIKRAMTVLVRAMMSELVKYAGTGIAICSAP